ncbi:TNT domain-containing protein [Streptomyces sp. LHD-70]|uniref:TNT domain-containing protein n=1 Tax=Streptomyces sp. LHD-70 TaxID=3072140 RepID=UPI00280C6C17|nr:TNT domain-containing protein [Streptomyces sp. LHD-70]MDQ8702813.1 TNT domain-containing protein [Streptomyces sp. LHD-70]
MKPTGPLRIVFAALGVTVTVALAPSAAAAPEAPGQTRAAAAPGATCTGEYHGDARLGPKRLPKQWHAPVGPLLKNWNRTGGLSDDAYLKKYWEGPADGGGWKYPPNDGFAEKNGEIDKEPTKLREGQRLDRFGSEYGAYLAPAGDPYEERALPPQNLNTRDASAPCDYRVYKVSKPFWVWQGSIAPWFEQPGGGQQIKLDAVFLDPGEGQRLNVKWLLEHGYLAPVPQ